MTGNEAARAMHATWIPCSRFVTEQSETIAAKQLATVLHSVLFAGPFFLPDSAYVNNRLLRLGMRSNVTLRQLVSSGMMQIARRTSDGRMRTLGEVCHEIEKNGGRSRSFPKEEFLNESDLEFIDERCVQVSYSIEDAGWQFSRDVLDLIRDEEAAVNAGLDVRIRKAIETAADEQCQRGVSLKHSFFVHNDELKSELDRIYPGEDLWARYQQIVRDFTKGPHVTCMANLLRVNPIFAPEHKKSIDIWRRRHLQKLHIEHVYEFNCRTGLETFVRGLLALTPDDMSELLECHERRAFFFAARSLTSKNESKNELVAAFSEFRQTIEGRILKRLNDRDDHAENGRLSVGFLERAKHGGETAGTEILGIIADAFIPGISTVKLVWSIIQSVRTNSQKSFARSPTDLADAINKVTTEKFVSRLEQDENIQEFGRLKSDISFQERNNMDMQIDIE